MHEFALENLLKGLKKWEIKKGDFRLGIFSVRTVLFIAFGVFCGFVLGGVYVAWCGIPVLGLFLFWSDIFEVSVFSVCSREYYGLL